MGQYLLGIDAGNTMVKAVLFDVAGREVASDAREGGTRHPLPGFVERDIAELWSCAAEAIRGCLNKAGIAPTEILAVGCAGHGNGLYLLDREAQPLLGVQSLDSRAADLVERWQTDGHADRLYPLCLQRPWPAQTATLLSWLRQGQSDLFDRIGHVLLCKDAIVYFLTGRIGSDVSDMSGAALLDIPSRGYQTELLAAYDLDGCERLLPELAEPTDIVGRINRDAASLTGLIEGTPVVAGLFDVVASALGSGVVDVGQASIVAGTWSINQVVTDAPLVNPKVLMASTFRRDRYMAIEASATSATNLEWFVREFMGDAQSGSRQAAFATCNTLAGQIRPSPDLPIYHPFLYGSNFNTAAKAGFYGLAGWHTRADMIYALLEGVVFGHRQHFRILQDAGARVDAAVLSGGASRSSVWPQIFADILEAPITITGCGETGALGAAMTAGIGAGVFPDFERAVSTMTQASAQFTPDRTYREVHQTRYRVFEHLCAAMSGPWAEMRAT